MTEEYYVLSGDKNTIYSNEIIEKKSRFIAYAKKVESVEEAVEFINFIKKKHYDANHNCSAFVIGKDKTTTRSSDDGEPSGTAGRPMLDVVLGSDIVNIAVVVTRYFGGIKLGTGGLVKVYQTATKSLLDELKLTMLTAAFRIIIYTDYNTIGSVLYEVKKRKIVQEDSEYTDKIILKCVIECSEYEVFSKLITDISSSKSYTEIIEKTFVEF